MLLSLKALALDARTNSWKSPTRVGFAWTPKTIMQAECDHPLRAFEDCTCGIYSSPNIAALDEYSGFPNSVLLLLNLYGRYEIWTGPKDIPHSYVLRSQGAKVVGAVRVLGLGGQNNWTSNRALSLSLACKVFQVQVYDLPIVQEMIRQNWLKEEEVNFDPYDKSISWNG